MSDLSKISAPALEALRQRLTRLERELVEARHEFTLLEGRLPIAPPTPPAPDAFASPSLASPESNLPPLHVVPPPLPAAARPLPSPSLTAAMGTGNVALSSNSASTPLPHLPAALPPARVAQHTNSAMAETAVVPPPLTKAEAAPLRVWLERLQLWPPSGEADSAEARLGAWWATRIGALLAMIGVVFFGIYVSLNTPPWVKFCQLLAVAIGVCGLGMWLERRLAAFGAVVLASGLAIGFFAAYAAHAVPAVRVLDSLTASVAWQGVVVTLIVGLALHRRSPLIATLALGLGHVTAIFSGLGGFDGLALGVAALLGVVAVALRRMRGWESPSVVAMPAGYLVYAMGLATAAPINGTAPLSFQPWPFLIGLSALYFARDWRRFPVAAAEVTAGESWFQKLNASAAVVLSLATALGWYRPLLGEFYLGAAVLLGTAAWLRTQQIRGGDTVATVLTAKALAALTLGIIELAEARTLALALLVQAWALAWSARRLQSRMMGIAASLSAVLATYFFFNHSGSLAPIWSVPAAQAVVFLLSLLALSHASSRWWLTAGQTRRTLDLAAALVGGGGASWVILRWTPTGWLPALAIGWAILFAGLTVARRSPGAAGAAGFIGSFAQLQLWLAAIGVSSARSGLPDGDGSGTLGWNAIAVLGPTLLAGAWLGRREDTPSRVGGTLAWALVVIGGALVLHAMLPLPLALAVLAGGAWCLALLAPSLPHRHLPWLATLALVFVAWFAVSSPPASLGYRFGSATTWATFTAMLGWALPITLRAIARCDMVRRSEGQPETMERILVLIATVLSVRAIGISLSGEVALLGLAALAAGLFILALRPGLRPALAASCLVWLLCGFAFWWVNPVSVWTICAAAVSAWVPVWIWRSAPQRWKIELIGWRRLAPHLQSGLASLIGLSAIWNGAEGHHALWLLIGLLVVSGLTHRPGGAAAARVAASVVAFILAVHAWVLIAARGAEGWGPGLAAVGVAAVTLAALPLWVDPAKKQAWRWTAGGTALTLLLLAWAGQHGALAPFATVAWGGVAILFFVVGLFWRIAPYRLLGLLGLALCIPRVFVVDLQSVLHRILAFIVIGLVILWVGFSYHRFRHLISSADTSRPST